MRHAMPLITTTKGRWYRGPKVALLAGRRLAPFTKRATPLTVLQHLRAV